MSYYTGNHSELIYFGCSAGSDSWIERNVEGAEPTRAPEIDAEIAPTEIYPGVLRYVRDQREPS